MKLGDKKAQGLSTNMIILIIIGIAVLVVMILGFTLGWSSLAPWISSTNVDTIVNTCDTKCSLGNKYDFCSADISTELKDDKGNKIITSCYALANIKEFQDYGIQKCSNINCESEQECESIKIEINGDTYSGEKRDSCDTENDIEISDIAKGLSSTSSDSEKCCLINAKTNLK